ncbi:MAG TPA: YkgJ family cysteine cluster protein [Ramlibacter sp.]|jgi:Fe-S-cluster containining protein|uniref:YkgJ family cysteine cluster protein n=1 Tax=Ramlibacter sp. TaxID=1917967 RepID=UPI002D28FDC7|nr:YkgJ family cysteine cluster protein [Ramlibacter sp.]HZY20384.1 YkgJ family cysteine cluster protein [Ramlibacter sp.]
MDAQPPHDGAASAGVDRSHAPHPCLACGACCASYRVDFAVEELDAHGGMVPSGLVVEVTETIVRMRGTDHVPTRCAALTGQVGRRAACGIYEWRPNPCRELEPGSQGCERARARHGLLPLPPGTA